MVNLQVEKNFFHVKIVVQVILKSQEQIILEGDKKMEGIVKFFNQVKGFGFIKAEDEKEYFVHISGVEGGVELNEGDKVTFETQEDDRGLKAVKVSVSSSDSEE